MRFFNNESTQNKFLKCFYFKSWLKMELFDKFKRNVSGQSTTLHQTYTEQKLNFESGINGIHL